MFRDPLYMSDENFRDWCREQNALHKNMTMKQAEKIYGKPSDVPGWLRGGGELKHSQAKASIGDWLIVGLLVFGLLVFLSN